MTHPGFESIAHLASRVLGSLAEPQTMPPFLRASVKHCFAGRFLSQGQALCLVQCIHLRPVPRWQFSVAKLFGIQCCQSCCRTFQRILQQLLQQFFPGSKITHTTFVLQKPGNGLKASSISMETISETFGNNLPPIHFGNNFCACSALTQKWNSRLCT